MRSANSLQNQVSFNHQKDLILIYRSMKNDNGKPSIAKASCTLIHRDGSDIEFDDKKLTIQNHKGLSCNDKPESVLPCFIPYSYREAVEKSKGIILPPEEAELVGKIQNKSKLKIWSLAGTQFTNQKITDALEIVVNNTTHANICPSEKMTRENLENAMIATRDNWSVIKNFMGVNV